MVLNQKIFSSILIAALATVPARAVVITDNADTYVDSNSPNSAYPSSQTMRISQHSLGLLRFALTALPANITSTQIAKATLQVWEIPTSINASESISVYALTEDFVASTVTYGTRPSMASSPTATVFVQATSRYIEIDITPLVKQWVTTPTSNHGIAILPSSLPTSLDLLLGTKWNTAGSQPPILDITVTAGQVIYSVCVGGSTSSISCSCTHVLSQTQVDAPGCLGDNTCVANTPTSSCSTGAHPIDASFCNTHYYGVCCVCSS